MEEIREKREEIIKRLKLVNEKFTDEVLEKATKEQMEKYLELVDEITARLEIIDSVLEENN